ncbi:HAD domain-containing protein [Nocardia carnea]|uniref:HAD domain-containing protein n=1 Tax=Nocardia carnea TaxID=37328 RepID=UPI002457A71F|nr:HAD domain-containing protein [Nocardia carnea]
MRFSADSPVLFLDVDGPLIPFGAPDGRYPAHPQPGPGATNPLLARLDPALGPLLAALSCELIWATTWMHEANRAVGPILGLPPLAVLDRPDTADDPVDAWFGLHWKTRALVDRAAGRPFIWVDDEIGTGDREWVTENHPGRALLHRVDARTGLRPDDFTVFTDWLQHAVS